MLERVSLGEGGRCISDSNVVTELVRKGLSTLRKPPRADLVGDKGTCVSCDNDSGCILEYSGDCRGVSGVLA